MPLPSIAALQALSTSDLRSPRERRLILLNEGLIAARAGLGSQVDAISARLSAQLDLPPELVTADRELMQAEFASTSSQSESAYAHGRAALRGYESRCAALQSLCDYRSRFSALRIVAWGAEWHSNNAIAGSRSQGMLDIAREAHDRRREAQALAQQAVISQIDSDSELAERLLNEALEVARTEGSPRLDVELGVAEAFIDVHRKDYEEARSVDERVLPIAEREHFTHSLMTLRVNLGDIYVRLGRPRDALRIMEPGLQFARQSHDLRRERYLHHNMTLARIGLGMSDAVKQDIRSDLITWARTGAPKERLEAFQELSAALDAAGERDAALDLFRQEQELVFASGEEHDMLARQILLQEQERDADRRAVKAWIVAGSAGLLVAAAIALLASRLRARERRLAINNEALRHHAARDPLTGLLNRDGLLRALHEDGLFERFAGTLVMIDIDHFKRINDTLGHAGGDAVLAEVAMRLTACVRDVDLIVRWGGEEMVVAVRTTPFDAEVLVDRIMRALGSTPVSFQQRSIQVTASIGYAIFPLQTPVRTFTFDESLAVVDAAMFHAKRTGRRSAVRVLGLPDELLVDLGGLPDALERGIEAGTVRVSARRMQVPGDGASDAAPVGTVSEHDAEPHVPAETSSAG